MITLLSKIFYPNYTFYDDAEAHTVYGTLCGTAGILLNLFLFSIKLLAGWLSGSIAIVADAFNNLSDAGSSLVTLFGFRLAGQKPDMAHPYGHGRMEYLAGLIVSFLILLMGFELIVSSIKKILHPAETLYSPLIFGILLLSILVKLYMYRYNAVIGKKIRSEALKAAATDSISDVFSTAVVLLSSLIGCYTSLDPESYCGVIVGLFILYAGIQAAKDTISPLLGKAPDPELVEKIREIVLADEAVLGLHDLMVHDYGPGRLILSLHAEVSADGNILELHDAIDNLEHILQDKLNCIAVIHMDPICNNDAETVKLKKIMQDYLASLSDKLSLHDFRIVKGSAHTNLIFDVLSPYDCPIPDEELLSLLRSYIASLEGNYYGVITLDKN